jgi:hypothetical protein
MNFVKINRGKVELRNSWGTLIRLITEGAKTADLSEGLVLVTKLCGQVQLRNSNGILVRIITSGANDAKFQGNNILIIKDRLCELRDQWGVLIRKY